MNRVSRRTFLTGLGATAALSPFVPSWVQRAGAAAPKRFIVFWTPNGLYEPEWTPSDGMELGRILQPLEAFKDRLMVFKNLDWQSYFADPSSPSNDHPPPLSHCLCATDVVDYAAGASGVGDAWGGGPSIDQFVAQRISEGARFESLLLTTEDTDRRKRLSYRAAREFVPPIPSPVTAFDRLFGDLDLGADDLSRVRAERRSVIDVVRADLEALQSRTGVAERRKIDAHLTHLRSLERRIADESAALSCTAPDLSVAGGEPEFVRHGRQHMDIMVSALACDLTRVAFLEWDGALTTHRWAGVDAAHHTYSHHNAGLSTDQNNEMLTRIGTWYAEQFAYLIGRLDSIPEGDGTMLDNSVVLWTSEHKALGGNHGRRDVPFLIAGSGGGYFRTGRKIECGSRAHNDLYVSICHALGLEDVTSFGNAEVCAGPIPGLT